MSWNLDCDPWVSWSFFKCVSVCGCVHVFVWVIVAYHCVYVWVAYSVCVCRYYLIPNSTALTHSFFLSSFVRLTPYP